MALARRTLGLECELEGWKPDPSTEVVPSSSLKSSDRRPDFRRKSCRTQARHRQSASGESSRAHDPSKMD